MKRGTYILLVLSFVYLPLSASAKVLFTDTFEKGIDRWKTNEEKLKAAGGDFKIITDNDSPKEFGPKVFSVGVIAGNNAIAYIKGLEFKDGVVLVLWRDVALPEDTDGPIVVRLQKPDEVPLDQEPDGYKIEFDTDTGFHIDTRASYAFIKDEAIKSSGKWNWVKFQLIGSELKAKTWDYGDKEPGKWILETKDETYKSGFVALRAWSGKMYVAFFGVADAPQDDLVAAALAVEAQGKLTITWGKIKNLKPLR